MFSFKLTYYKVLCNLLLRLHSASKNNLHESNVGTQNLVKRHSYFREVFVLMQYQISYEFATCRIGERHLLYDSLKMIRLTILYIRMIYH